MGGHFDRFSHHRYGNEKRTDKFHNEKYFNAFLMLLESISYPTYTTKESYAGHCYSLRTFDRFLSFFGGVRIEQERGMDAEKFIVKGDVFDKMFELLDPRISEII